MKINLGAGTDIREGFVNHDIASISGIDVVFDLNHYPWPWDDNSVDEIIAKDLLEHLDNFMRSMEEVYRVLAPSGIARIKVPYWNSCNRYADPTHKMGFHEITFKFFDPSSIHCQERHYYTHARFSIIEEVFIIAPFTPYLHIPGLSEIRIKNRITKRIIGFIGNIVSSNLILDLDMVMKKIPSEK